MNLQLQNLLAKNVDEEDAYKVFQAKFEECTKECKDIRCINQCKYQIKDTKIFKAAVAEADTWEEFDGTMLLLL